LYHFHEEHLLVAGEMMEEGICFSPCSLKLTTWFDDICLAILLSREDVEMHLHSLQTKTVCMSELSFWKKYITVRKQHLDHRMHLVT
jgi:hypothetical protein